MLILAKPVTRRAACSYYPAARRVVWGRFRANWKSRRIRSIGFSWRCRLEKRATTLERRNCTYCWPSVLPELLSCLKRVGPRGSLGEARSSLRLRLVPNA